MDNDNQPERDKLKKTVRLKKKKPNSDRERKT